MLGNGLEVGKNLARVEFIGQSVHHRMGGILRHFLHTILTEGAPHHTIGHAVKYTCGVCHRFATAQLGSGLVDDQRIATQFGNANGEAGTGSGARLVEDHRDALRSGERLMVETVVMEFDGKFENLLLLFMVEIVIAQHVAQFRSCHCWLLSKDFRFVVIDGYVQSLGRSVGIFARMEMA